MTMEWVGQIKGVVKTRVDGLKLAKLKKHRGVKIIIHQMARESGIPRRVLTDYYFNTNGDTEVVERPLCIKCNKNRVLLTDRGKPYSPASIHYGLCSTCKNREYIKRRKDNE